MKITNVKVTGILVMLIINNVQGMLVTKPKDAAAKIGDIVTMRCSSSDVNDVCGKITWKHFKMGSNSEDPGDYINVDGQLSPAFTSYISLFNSSAGNCDLRINATPSAAGRYQCLDTTPDHANAELIVFENDPEFEISRKSRSGIITLGCSVNYYGNWAPKVQWGKIVGNSWTSVASNDSDKSKSPVSSLIQMPSAPFDSTGATEYFVCNVTIFKSGGSNMPIYNWQSLKYDTNWGKGVDQVSCDGCGIAIDIGLVLFVMFDMVLSYL